MSTDRASAADARVLALVRDYAQLAGGTFEQLEHDLYQLSVPRGDERYFDGRSAVRIAFSVDALELDDRAEMAIVGSTFVGGLIEAIRTRGARLTAGDVVPALLAAPENPALPVPIRAGEVRESRFELARHRAGRLTARVVLRAGTEIRERLADSTIHDLCSGLPLPADVAQACESAVPLADDQAQRWNSIASPPSLPVARLVERMLGDLEATLRPEVDQVGSSATTALDHELNRIDRYYKALLDDIGGRGTGIPDAATRRDVEAEHHRRAEEERDRHRVRAVVHPVQMTEWNIAVQRATWELRSPSGHTGTLTAQRALAGRQEWSVGCEVCGATSADWVAVCTHDHVSCSGCTAECSVCKDSFCRQHGIARCHVDGRPACDAHARKCASCRREHCATHEGICDDGGHAACTTCLGPCAGCGRSICETHALKSSADAPRGARRFCHACALYCEGGTGEIVGPDEVADCASCSRVVCERHQARCDVDGKVHCSKHLRRTDRSRRLVCETDRMACAHEPNSVFARDEIVACATCGREGCDQHVLECIADLRRHCAAHLLPVRDQVGKLACLEHTSQCHVDGVVFTTAGTRPCPCCDRRTCREHMRECTNCRRQICTADFADAVKVCATCARLEEVAEPTDAMLFAAIDLRGDDAGSPKAWKVARDARHVLAEIELGWTRRIVMAIPHGEQRAQSAISHSALGSKVLR